MKTGIGKLREWFNTLCAWGKPTPIEWLNFVASSKILFHGYRVDVYGPDMIYVKVPDMQELIESLEHAAEAFGVMVKQQIEEWDY